LRDALIPFTEEEGNWLFGDVWAARDAYIDVILDRSESAVKRFLKARQNHELTAEERVRALKLMEMQRHAQLMYTSCGWFFDDISGIETVQVIAYAARVLQLAQELFGERVAGLQPAFLAQLKDAGSNDAKAGDGARIYGNAVSRMKVGLEQVAAHYAISSMFSAFGDETEIYSYCVRRLEQEIFTSGRGRLGVGKADVTSEITGDQQMFQFAVLHLGDQNITAAVKPYSSEDEEAFARFSSEAADSMQRADIAGIVRLLDRTFERLDYSLTSLFLDDQRRIVRMILNTTLGNIEDALMTIYEDHESLLHYLSQSGLQKPPALTLAAGFAVNAGVRRAIESDPVDQAQLKSFLSRAKADQVQLETANLSYIADQRMKRAMVELQGTPTLETLDRAYGLARALADLPIDHNLWQAQNIWYDLLRHEPQTLSALTTEERARWDEEFTVLGECLAFDTASIRVQDPAATTVGD
ncbi:MAG TPA: DUF3536 domain-containing protein, partial [Terracidiphilus sp.]